MKEILIEELAYLIKEAKNKGAPQPIFFLGAGASVTGKIPLAGDIGKKIRKDYAENPFVQKLKPEEQQYATLMDCLLPTQRTELMKSYIDEAKINVTHIYLAQLIKEGYADYVLTVNFDNLMLRALALYNIFPPTYDLSILKDLTTTTFNESSVTYLHGKYNGPWILNTEAEMERVKAIVQRIFDSIKNKRPWIFIGYSGSDPIFEHVRQLGRFDNGLYWVGYKEHPPAKKVQEFLNDPNTNSYHIKGYDADAFMLKLNEGLKLPQPDILNKPFSLLKEMLGKINDIDDQEYFKGVKERLAIAKKKVSYAIIHLEEGKPLPINYKDGDIDQLKKEIINLLISEKYGEEQIIRIEEKILKTDDLEAKELISQYYYYWGNKLGDQTEEGFTENIDETFLATFNKYEKATRINPNLKEAWLNWAVRLGNMANSKSGKEAETLYEEAFIKYEKSLSIEPNYVKALACWGVDLGDLAELKHGKEAKALYELAYDKFNQALKLNPNHQDTMVNFAMVLESEAKSTPLDDSILLLKEAIEYHQKAIDIAISDDIYYNWGNTLGMLGNLINGKNSDEYFLEAFEKYENSYTLNDNCFECLNNWAGYLIIYAEKKPKEYAYKLFEKSIRLYKLAIKKTHGSAGIYANFGKGLLRIYKYQKQHGDQIQVQTLRLAKDISAHAVEHGAPTYTLACCYAELGELSMALKLLDLSMKNDQVNYYQVLNDSHWQQYSNTLDFKAVIDNYN